MTRLSLEIRDKIVKLFEEGYSQVYIAKKFGVFSCAVQKLLKKHKETKCVEDKPKTGRPSKLSILDKRAIIRESKRYPFKTANEIKKSLTCTKNVCTETVKRVLRKYGLMGRIAVKKPFLNRRHKKNRLEYCLERRDWDATKWGKILFSDECKLCAGLRSRQYVRRPAGQRIKEKYLNKT